jgi:phosphomannomutase
MLELLAASGRTVSALRDALPRYHVVKEKVPVAVAEAPALLRAVRRAYEGRPLNLLDGVFVDFGDRWLNVRRSNTEPILRIVAEAQTPAAARALADEVRAVLARAVPP